jgi:ferrous iron transport protein B
MIYYKVYPASSCLVQCAGENYISNGNLFEGGSTLGNSSIGRTSLASHITSFLNTLDLLLGLDGVILLAYIIVIAANEIVVTTMMMHLGVGVMTDIPEITEPHFLSVNKHGKALPIFVDLMHFSLLHDPCITTILTIC